MKTDIIPTPVRKGENTFDTLVLEKAILYRTQVFYKKNLVIKQDPEATVIICEADPVENMVEKFFFVNCREPIEGWIGCDVDLVRCHDDYTTYKISPRGVVKNSVSVFNHI